MSPTTVWSNAPADAVVDPVTVVDAARCLSSRTLAFRYPSRLRLSLTVNTLSAILSPITEALLIPHSDRQVRRSMQRPLTSHFSCCSTSISSSRGKKSQLRWCFFAEGDRVPEALADAVRSDAGVFTESASEGDGKDVVDVDEDSGGCVLSLSMGTNGRVVGTGGAAFAAAALIGVSIVLSPSLSPTACTRCHRDRRTVAPACSRLPRPQRAAAEQVCGVAMSAISRRTTRRRSIYTCLLYTSPSPRD